MKPTAIILIIEIHARRGRAAADRGGTNPTPPRGELTWARWASARCQGTQTSSYAGNVTTLF